MRLAMTTRKVTPLLMLVLALTALQRSEAVCSSATATVLTTCTACGTDPCVLYGGTTKCSTASRNKCLEDATSGCTYQCLVSTYNPIYKHWTLFVKDPEADDKFVGHENESFPSAPVEQVRDYQLAEAVEIAQIAGFSDVLETKDSVKSLALDDNVFKKAKTLKTLSLTSLDIAAKLQTSGFMPTSMLELQLDNCKLDSVPQAIATMGNLKNLSLKNNHLTSFAATNIAAVVDDLVQLDLYGNDLTDFSVSLPELKKLNLSNNKLAAFPTVVFNMTQLTALTIDGNRFHSVTVTPTQLAFLKRLKSSSRLGVTSSGSCGSGTTETNVLDSVVCLSSSDATPAKSSSSSSTIIIIVIVVAVIGLAVAGFFLYRRRKSSRSAFFDMVAHDQHRSLTMNTEVALAVPLSNSRMSPVVDVSVGKSRSDSTSMSRQNITPTGTWTPGGRRSVGTEDSLSVYTDLVRPQETICLPTAAVSLPVDPVRTRRRQNINQNVVRIDSEDLQYTRLIAKGAHGEVWLAQCRGTLVAVKKMLVTNQQSVGDFVAELNLLSTLVHPRVLPLLGACWKDDLSDIAIVTDYMDSGDLLTVLKRRSPSELTWENGKAAYCLHICEALFYLHSLQPAIIHRDLKSRNVLVDSRKGAKISDFGESRERTFDATFTGGVGTARWVAPEIIMGEDYNELADIYSLGVVFCELDTHKIPFEDMDIVEAAVVQQVSLGKLRPTVTETCPEVIRRLTHECLQYDPQLRPSAARVLQTLMSSPLFNQSMQSTTA